MRTFAVVLFVICVAGSSPLAASEEVSADRVEGKASLGIRCEEMVFCAGVKDRAPVGTARAFPADIFSVYCFTAVVGAQDTTAVAHNWYFGDKKMATVELPVKSARWRTWSSKRMVSDWRGTWKVEVTAADGAVIESGQFTLE